MDLTTVLQKGLISDPEWMKTHTVVLRVQRQKNFVTVNREQIMTDLAQFKIGKKDLIGIGESGNGVWEIYCFSEQVAQWLHI